MVKYDPSKQARYLDLPMVCPAGIEPATYGSKLHLDEPDIPKTQMHQESEHANE